MKKVELKVELLNYTPNPVMTIAMAARLSHYGKSIDELREEVDERYAEDLVRRLINLGHHSVLEHVSFTFGIEGFSRISSQQLTRHRIASYTQQSQRYVSMNNFNYIIPKSIEKNEEAKKIYLDALENAKKAYEELRKLKIKKEDARFVLPNGVETKIIATFNARELRHIFLLRISKEAQWEIRELAKKMFFLVEKVAPVLVEDLKEKLYWEEE